MSRPWRRRSRLRCVRRWPRRPETVLRGEDMFTLTPSDSKVSTRWTPSARRPCSCGWPPRDRAVLQQGDSVVRSWPRFGHGREGTIHKRPNQPQFLHEFEDALGDGGVGLGAGDVVNHSASFSWKHGVKSFQKFRVVVEHVLQILGDRHAVFALVHGQIHMHPAAKCGLGGLDLALDTATNHRPSPVGRPQCQVTASFTVMT